MLALLLAPLLLAAGEPAYLASCPAVDGRVVSTAPVDAPPNIHPTNRRARFLIDLGSDGAIRRVAIVETSGDAAFDAAAQSALAHFRFAPPQQGCISTSSVVPETFNVPLINLIASPPPGGTLPVIPSALPASAVTICAAPFVQLTGIDVPDQRQPPGTVDVDVGLDAQAHVLRAALVQSSGNRQTDAGALAAARDAQYAFTPQPGCPPKPTTYRLELTYH
jgi:TonB family protein